MKLIWVNIKTSQDNSEKARIKYRNKERDIWIYLSEVYKRDVVMCSNICFATGLLILTALSFSTSQLYYHSKMYRL